MPDTELSTRPQLPPTRPGRIELAAKIIESRVYTVNLDNPSMVVFEVTREDYTETYDLAGETARRLLRAGFLGVSYGSPTLGPGIWHRSVVAVEVGL